MSSGVLTLVDNVPLAPAGTIREFRGKDTFVQNARNSFYTDGTLIIKEGAGLDVSGGEGPVIIGANLPGTPGDLHTVVDISGPGSRLYWRETERLDYGLYIGHGWGSKNPAKSVTINISDGGSFVFDHPDAGEYSIGEEHDVTFNITGAGSKMALIRPVLYAVGALPRPGRERFAWTIIGSFQTGLTNVQLALGRGGVFEFTQDLGLLRNVHFRYTIGDDGTGKSASGLFRTARTQSYKTDSAIVVDPCTNLKPGDQSCLQST
jgi:hypothetical protein